MSFLPVKGYEESYEVSDSGCVRSIDRVTVGSDGVPIPKWGKVLKPSPHKDTGYLQVSLWHHNSGTSYYVHRLVAEVHIPNPSNLPEVNHKDGCRQNNHISNLEWVTSLDNKIHAITTGLRVYTNRLTKEEFVDCLLDVIAGESFLSLTDRVPYKVPYLSTKLRKIAREVNLEEELDSSLALQRITRARINGVKNHPTYC